jgi:TRAP-type C4-dicarboxylate transport system substrate-binding protein
MGIRAGASSKSIAALAVLGVGAAACGGTDVADRAGGDTVELRLATVDGDAGGLQPFVDALGEVSGGRLQVEVVTEFGGSRPDAESRLVAAIASGEVDGGAPGTRAFAEAGIDGLAAIEAPMVLTSHAAVQELLDEPVAQQILATLDGTGLTAVGLVAGPLRRPFAAEGPLLGVEDWQGVSFRSYNSPVQSDAIRALGGTPVVVMHAWHDHVREGALRGAELDVPDYLARDRRTVTPYVAANVVLWPKVLVLALNEERYAALSDDQRGWVREAAAQVTGGSGVSAEEEDRAARQLCDVGVRFPLATEEQLAALEAAFVPVLDGLRADPATAPVMELVDAIGERHHADVVDVPEECRTVVVRTQPEAEPPTVAEIPDGLYRVEISEDAVAAAGRSNDDGWSGTWTLTVQDGTYALTCRPLERPGRDCGGAFSDNPLEAGYLRGDASSVSFVFDAELLASLSGCTLPASTTTDGACYPLPTYSADWALAGDELTFTDVAGEAGVYLGLGTWRKIG